MAWIELLTSQARGAIAVVRVSGEDAVEVADRVFRGKAGRGLTATGMNRLRLGRVGPGLGDEVVAVVTDGPAVSVEFQCHGGVMAVDLVSTALLSAGARWGDGSVGNGPRLERQAIEDLIRSRTVATAEILLEQSQGALRAAIHQVIDDLKNDRQSEAGARLDRLMENGRVGLRLLTGWRVALAGRPNVGKSRLLNALAGYERAIVDATPGTTRDTVAVRAAIGGWPVEFIDTAGLRASDDEIERQGVARSCREHQQADLVLLLLDRSVALTGEDLGLLERMPRTLVVANKSDLASAWTGEEAELGGRSMVIVSATSGEGMDWLIEAMIGRLVGQSPGAGEGVPFRAEYCDAFGYARQLATGGRFEEAQGLLEAILE